MNWGTIFTILILLVIGDGIAAVFGFRSCLYVYRKVGVSKYTKRLSLFLAVFMIVLALVGLSEIVNSLLHGKEIVACQPKSQQLHAVITRIARSIPTWLVAWQLTKTPAAKGPTPNLPQ